MSCFLFRAAIQAVTGNKVRCPCRFLLTACWRWSRLTTSSPKYHDPRDTNPQAHALVFSDNAEYAVVRLAGENLGSRIREAQPGRYQKHRVN